MIGKRVGQRHPPGERLGDASIAGPVDDVGIFGEDEAERRIGSERLEDRIRHRVLAADENFEQEAPLKFERDVVLRRMMLCTLKTDRKWGFSSDWSAMPFCSQDWL